MAYGLSLKKLYMIPDNIKRCGERDTSWLGQLLYHDENATKEDILNFTGFNINQKALSGKETFIKNSFHVKCLNRMCKILCFPFYGSLEIVIKRLCCFLSNLKEYQYYLNNLKLEINPLQPITVTHYGKDPKFVSIEKQLVDLAYNVNNWLIDNDDLLMDRKDFSVGCQVDIGNNRHEIFKFRIKTHHLKAKKTSQKYLRNRDKRTPILLPNELQPLILKKSKSQLKKLNLTKKTGIKLKKDKKKTPATGINKNNKNAALKSTKKNNKKAQTSSANISIEPVQRQNRSATAQKQNTSATTAQRRTPVASSTRRTISRSSFRGRRSYAEVAGTPIRMMHTIPQYIRANINQAQNVVQVGHISEPGPSRAANFGNSGTVIKSKGKKKKEGKRKAAPSRRPTEVQLCTNLSGLARKPNLGEKP